MGTNNADNSCAHVHSNPGPVPTFTERIVVKLSPDQHQAVQRIALTLGFTVCDVVRWFIDEGARAVEAVPTFTELKGSTHD
jgi:hypothetical protein